MLAISAGIFAVVVGLLVYSIVRFRRRPDDDGSEPPQVYGSNPIELAWTVVPILIVFVLFLVTARTMYEVQAATKPPDALEVTVVGHQWWWEFRYPELGVVTANELHVPVSAAPTDAHLPRRSSPPTSCTASGCRGSPARPTSSRTGATACGSSRCEPGLYLGQCAEYCGTQHAHMLLRVVVAPAGGVRRAGSRRSAQPAVARSRGRRRARSVFETTACINCHTRARHRSPTAASAPTSPT